MRIKKNVGLWILLLAVLCAICCASAEEKLTIVTTDFPEYDLCRAIAGDLADVTMLLPPGAEIHSFEPTPQDMIAIANADLFVYNGGESEVWVDTILESLGEDAPAVLRMMDCVRTLEEEESESMTSEESEEETDETEWDEHVWTSPKNMLLIADALCDTLCGIAPEQSAAFEEALQLETAALTELDETFTAIVQNAERDILIFGDRFPFRYFVEDYGLRYDAAFPGCSEDTEPDVHTVISLIDRIVKEKIPAVLTIECSAGKTADILCEETGAVRRTLHSCQIITPEELAAGVTYIDLMKANAEVLKEVLGACP